MALRLTEAEYEKLLGNNATPEEVKFQPVKEKSPKKDSVHIGQELHQARYLIYAAAAGRIMCTPLFWILAIILIQVIWPFILVYGLKKWYDYHKAIK